MALNTCETWSDGINIAFFQKDTKNRPAAGASPSDPLLRYVWITMHFFTQTRLTILTFSQFNYWFKPSPLNEFLVTCQHQATTSDLPFYDIFTPHKNSSFEVSDDAIACDLWFGPLPPIKNPGYAIVDVRCISTSK